MVLMSWCQQPLCSLLLSHGLHGLISILFSAKFAGMFYPPFSRGVTGVNSTIQTSNLLITSSLALPTELQPTINICVCMYVCIWVYMYIRKYVNLPATQHFYQPLLNVSVDVYRAMPRNMFSLYKTCTFPYVHVAGGSRLHRHMAGVWFLIDMWFPWSRPHLKWPDGRRKHAFTQSSPQSCCARTTEALWTELRFKTGVFFSKFNLKMLEKWNPNFMTV